MAHQAKPRFGASDQLLNDPVVLKRIEAGEPFESIIVEKGHRVYNVMKQLDHPGRRHLVKRLEKARVAGLNGSGSVEDVAVTTVELTESNAGMLAKVEENLGWSPTWVVNHMIARFLDRFVRAQLETAIDLFCKDEPSN